jgi:hypothetical protein
MTLQIHFSHPSLVIPIKLTPGQHIGRGLRIANHLDESLWWPNQKHSAAIRSYLSHSFLQVYSAAAPFHQPRQCVQLCEAKTIFLSQTGKSWIFFIQFYCARSHTGHRWRYSYIYTQSCLTPEPMGVGHTFIFSLSYLAWFLIKCHNNKFHIWYGFEL